MTRRFSATPRWVLLPAGVGALLILLPLVGMLLRIDWAHLGELLTSESSLAALWLSLRTAVVSTVLCVVLGCPLALVLARSTARGLTVFRSLVLLPLVMPPVVGGIALLYTFGRTGFLGRPLGALGVDIAFSTAAVVLAHHRDPLDRDGLEAELPHGARRVTGHLGRALLKSVVHHDGAHPHAAAPREVRSRCGEREGIGATAACHEHEGRAGISARPRVLGSCFPRGRRGVRTHRITCVRSPGRRLTG